MEKFKITFYPDNKTIEVENDKTILSAAISAGVYINSACGGDGVCGKCKVVVKKGKVLTQSTGNITEAQRKKNIYLACVTTIHSDVEVEVPKESSVDFQKVDTEEMELARAGFREESFEHSPLTSKLFLKLPKPTLEDNASDLDRLYKEIQRAKNIDIRTSGLVNIRSLAELFRDSEWKVTVTLGDRNAVMELVLVEPGDTSAKNFGICCDIGTTTVSSQLVDLETGKILGTRATYNKQASFGSDVITRIVYADQPEGLEKLHKSVIDSIDQMILELITEHKVDLNDVTSVVCAGNTTMIHLLLQIDPSFIRKEPYVPTANFLPVMRAQEAGIRINPRGILSIIPGVAGYVGGDATAGVLYCGLYKQDELSILIDIGTNGEIVLGNKEFMIAAAASAGPAFEGSGVSCGMRAGRGAIQKVKINPKDFSVTFDTIADEKPKGICGSGYIGLLAEMLKYGVIDKNGKIILEHSRVRQRDLGKEFLVTDDIAINEADIDNLKRAKAAIYSATAILCRHMGIDLAKIKRFFIAGGFGAYLDIPKAIQIGLLPDIERSKFVFIGNSSLAGSRLALLSSEARQEADRIARRITYFELSTDPKYMDEYMAALFFPHTDLNRFPSVKV